MQVTWEAKDIKPGRVVGVVGRRERWMIGYRSGSVSAEPRYAMISLSDGAVVHCWLDPAQMAERLNSSHELPAELLETWSRATLAGG